MSINKICVLYKLKTYCIFIVMGISSSKQTIIPKKKEKTYAPVCVKEEKEKEQLPDNKDKKPKVHDIYENEFILLSS